MRRSWASNQNTFITILLIFFLIHLGALFTHLKMKEVPTLPPPVAGTKAPIKVQLEKLPQDQTKKQIVQSEDGGIKKKVDDAYLSDKDRAFDRESVARNVDTFKSGKSSGGGSEAQSRGGKTKSKRREAKTKKGVPKDMKLSDLGANVGAPDPFLSAAKDYTAKKNGHGPGKESSQRVSSTNDHVTDVPLGDVTHLNTAEYKYYGFYHRIKQRLEQFWGRSIQEKAEQLAKGGRRVASDDELITSLQITLNHVGEVVEIRITGTSGVKELDDAAIESFNQAGPFPNPPKGLIRNGRVTLEWGFVINT